MFKKSSFCFFEILKNRKGFTLTELVVTLGILSIMMTIAIPSYFSWLPRHKLETSVRQIYDDMNLAKIRAVQGNRNACITFDTVAETYTVFFDVDGIAGYNAGVDILIKGNVRLENGVDITGTTLTANTCGFNNRGLLPTGFAPALVQGQVSLTNPTNLPMTIIVNAAGGISVI
jgi:prepilin-type N-terminal cleavage/methylation domain-containing protein